MQNGYLNIILKTVNEINKMVDINKRNKRIYRLYSYGSFCYYSGYITLKEYVYAFSMIKDDLREKQLEESEEKDIITLINNNELLSDFYKKYLCLYSPIFIKNENELSNIKIAKDTYKLFREFLKYINCEKLYYELLSKNKISFHSRIADSKCIDDYYDSYIIINSINKFGKYSSLAHELGHAYEYRIMCNREEDFLPRYNCEIISILFHRIFKEFIIQSNLLNINEKKELNINFEEINHNHLLISSYITDIVSEGNYKIFDFEICKSLKKGGIRCDLNDHNYAIGSIISLILLDEWRKSDRQFVHDLPSLIKYIHNIDLRELITHFDYEESFNREIKRLVK